MTLSSSSLARLATPIDRKMSPSSGRSIGQASIKAIRT
jgi:hypothetical protein